MLIFLYFGLTVFIIIMREIKSDHNSFQRVRAIFIWLNKPFKGVGEE